MDVLRRAGTDVTLAKVATKNNGGDLKCLMSRGINLIADTAITDNSVKSSKYDAIVLPGGIVGSTTMAKD